MFVWLLSVILQDAHQYFDVFVYGYELAVYPSGPKSVDILQFNHDLMVSVCFICVHELKRFDELSWQYAEYHYEAMP